MKSLLAMLFVFSISMQGQAAGGDLGGGGVAKPLIPLTAQEKQALQTYPDQKTAFEAWLKSIDAKKEVEILRKVFDHHVVPQINKP